MGLPGKNSYASATCNTYAGYFPGADYTAYGRLNEGRLGTTSKSGANGGDQRPHARAVRGDEGAGHHHVHDDLPGHQHHHPEPVSASCATDSDHYFNSPTNSQLEEAFEQIADELSNLRIAE